MVRAATPRPKGPEHTEVRLPVIARLLELGWSEGQLRWDPEWRVPRTPHDSAKRERSTSFESWPVDLVIFDSDEHIGEWEHALAILEFEEPTLEEGQSQLEIYLSREPRAKYGFWTNGDQSVAVYKLADGSVEAIEGANLPRPEDNLSKPSSEPPTYARLNTPPRLTHPVPFARQPPQRAGVSISEPDVPALDDEEPHALPAGTRLLP